MKPLFSIFIFGLICSADMLHAQPLQEAQSESVSLIRKFKDRFLHDRRAPGDFASSKSQDDQTPRLIIGRSKRIGSFDYSKAIADLEARCKNSDGVLSGPKYTFIGKERPELEFETLAAQLCSSPNNADSGSAVYEMQAWATGYSDSRDIDSAKASLAKLCASRGLGVVPGTVRTYFSQMLMAEAGAVVARVEVIGLCQARSK